MSTQEIANMAARIQDTQAIFTMLAGLSMAALIILLIELNIKHKMIDLTKDRPKDDYNQHNKDRHL